MFNRIKEENFDLKIDLILEEIKKYSFFDFFIKNYENPKEILISFLNQYNEDFHISEILVADIVCAEICKLNGKFKPLSQTVYIQ